ncbi:hypothetical protein pipiens_010212 [Culex pipiens pipiens]|uniref:Uncharacterized protein n=1 Tax=Culex pipiens pipiens TaxID=38569 RepID=A0ABD1DB22_CULPP
MGMLVKTHTERDLPDDDLQTSYLISAWARICKILGKLFEQYLPLVMGPVMRTASTKLEVGLLDNDVVQNVDGDNNWQFVNLGSLESARPFYFHDGVRKAVGESLSYLLYCAKIKGPTYLEGMWIYNLHLPLMLI